MNTTSERAKAVIVEVLGVRPEQLTSEAEFAADLGIDSLHQVEVFMALEQEFDIAISNDDADQIVTVGEALAWIEAEARKKSLLSKPPF